VNARSSAGAAEPMGVEYAPPDGFYQAPLTVTDKIEILCSDGLCAPEV